MKAKTSLKSIEYRFLKNNAFIAFFTGLNHRGDDGNIAVLMNVSMERVSVYKKIN